MTVRPWVRIALVSAALATSCAACSSSAEGGGQTSSPSESPTTTMASSPRTAPTTDAAQAAVLTAYRGFYKAMDQAYATPAKARELLATYATDPQLSTTAESIRAQAAAGYVPFGVAKLSPKSATITGATARVKDCQDSSQAGIKDRAGKTLRIGKADAEVLTTLKLDGGAWKVTTTEYPQGHPAGYCE